MRKVGTGLGKGGKPAIQILDTRTGVVYPSIRQCSRALGITDTTILTHVKGRAKNSKVDLTFLKVVQADSVPT